MSGFIKKDLAIIRCNLKTYLIILIVYLIFSIYQKINISFMGPFFSIMLIFTTFNYDNYSKWDMYAATLPKGRINNVLAKYLTTFILCFISSLFCSIFNYFLIDNYSYLSDFGSLLGTIMVIAIFFPIIYKFGIEKARIIIFGLVFAFIFLGMFLLNNINLNNISFNFSISLFIIGIIILLLISIFLSIRISLKKEY